MGEKPKGNRFTFAGAARVVVELLMRNKALCAAMLTLLAALGSHAGGMQNYNEDGGLVRGNTQPTALGSNAFGEQINGYTGAVSFSQLDVSLPGNSSLPVELRRKLVTGLVSTLGGSDWRWFGDWDLDLPHIRTFAPMAKGWQLWAGSTGSPENWKRCTHLGQDLLPMTEQSTNVLPGQPVVELSGPQGGGEILVAAGTYPTPADGLSYHLMTQSGWQLRCKGWVRLQPQESSQFCL